MAEKQFRVFQGDLGKIYHLPQSMAQVDAAVAREEERYQSIQDLIEAFQAIRQQLEQDWDTSSFIAQAEKFQPSDFKKGLEEHGEEWVKEGIVAVQSSLRETEKKVNDLLQSIDYAISRLQSRLMSDSIATGYVDDMVRALGQYFDLDKTRHPDTVGLLSQVAGIARALKRLANYERQKKIEERFDSP